MSLGDWIWLAVGALVLAIEVWAIFYTRGERTLTRVVRRWLGVSPLSWRRFVAVPLLWAGLVWLAWHLAF